MWHFGDLQRAAFAENVLFKCSGIIFLPPLPSTLPDKLLVADRKQCIDFNMH